MLRGGGHNCTPCLGRSWEDLSAVGLTAQQGLGQHTLLRAEEEGKRGEGERERKRGRGEKKEGKEEVILSFTER